MSLASLPLFMAVEGRPVMLLGDGPAAAAKRRLLERAGATIVGEEGDARLAIVALEEGAEAAVARLRARGVLVNAVDRPDLCDFTLPAIVERGPVVVAVGTGGVSAGLAAALRQRLEVLLPAGLGRVAEVLYAARDALRAAHPDAGERRRAVAALLAEGGPLDPLRDHRDPLAIRPSLFPDIGRGPGETDPAAAALAPGLRRAGKVVQVVVTSPDPDELTLRAARLLAQADRVIHPPGMPAAILDRARADAARIAASTRAPPAPGLTVTLVWSTS